VADPVNGADTCPVSCYGDYSYSQAPTWSPVNPGSPDQSWSWQETQPRPVRARLLPALSASASASASAGLLCRAAPHVRSAGAAGVGGAPGVDHPDGA
jgi:hypothetical protein